MPAVVVAAGATPEERDEENMYYSWADAHIADVVICAAEGNDRRHLYRYQAEAIRLGLIEPSDDGFRTTERGEDLYRRLLRRLPAVEAMSWVPEGQTALMAEVASELEKLKREERKA
ncbi:hypothetical protein [Saccharopolyspora sp. 6V]|uniref:hypothetical protein n=1 Tax=Saccharopolyspora sp. 6V TaxID=2877239 RepID=UPI001CD36F1B|nr:hypothetical protein [Saccharopolyspora sp. 6V]MCA1191678.1 hypothetical protein [Saccharopolyspora sp. 6V]